VNQIDYDNLIHYRFARRVGELHPDAQYANPFELPPSSNLRISKRALVIVLIVAILATLGALS
jgi:hypothetical protein